MDGDVVMYGLHWVFAICALLFSWSRTRHQFLHPHFLFTAMICVHISDFLVRGFTEERNLVFLERSDVYRYQIIILAILSATVLLTSLLRTTGNERLYEQATQGLRNVSGTRALVYWAVGIILVSELLKRFATVDWSVDEFMRQTMLPRGTRDWELAAYSGNFVFALTQAFMPLAGAAAAYLTTGGRAYEVAISFALMALVVLILVFDGSRTPVAIVFASFALFWTMKHRSLQARAVILGGVAAVMVTTFSIMFLFRAGGYMNDDGDLPDDRAIEVQYHQDDSYYRAIYAYAHSEQTGKAWSAVDFAYAIVTNPIPRTFWPDKPLLDTVFWDGFKLDYVTNLFLGEVVAMTGPALSLVFAPLTAFGICFLLFRSQRLLRYPLGLVAYLLMALYTYQCLRSLLNITQYMYLPLFAIVMTLLMNFLQSRRLQRQQYYARAKNRGGL